MATKKRATKAEREHLAKVAGLGCIVCANNGYPDNPAEIHHITTGAGMGRRNSHYQTIPLCFGHHSAQSDDGFHHSPRAWQKVNGTQEQLLEQVQGLL